MEKNPQSVFIPLGGANQDDSIINPSTQTSAGIKSSFGLGDFRYALNCRIGSSRGDNFGDIENIKGTQSYQDYYAIQQIFQNSDFAGSLDNWSQLDGAGYISWLYNINARLRITPNSTSPVLYYNVTSFSDPSNPSFPGSTFTQANFAEASTFTIGQTAVFNGSIYYSSGYIVFVGSGFIIFQHSFVGNDVGVRIAYGVGPPVYIPTNFISKVIYQTTNEPIVGVKNGIHANIIINGAISSGVISVIYMNDDIILSEEIISSGVVTSLIYNEFVIIPENCNGIGIRVSGTVSTVLTVDLEYFKDTLLLASERPTGDEQVIGKYEDVEFQRIYQCVWNENDNHTIRYFDPYTNITYEILKWAGLNFSETSFVKMAKLDNWIAITDRINPPRLINTDTISDLFLTLGESEFREFHISFHKWAPTAPAIPRVYYDNITNNYEKLKNKIFHFSYRYVYYGNLKSRWSPISKGAITTTCGNYYGNESDISLRSKRITAIEVDIPGIFYDDPSSSNAYNFFDHSDIKFTNAVQYIELAFRDGELELWKLWKVITVNGGYNRYQYFDGSGNLTPISSDDFNQLFDTVPFLAGTVEAIDNRFVFGDCLDEQEPSTGLSVTDITTVNDPLTDWDDSTAESFPTIPLTPRTDLLKKNALSSFNFKDRGIYKVGIQWMHRNGWRSAVYTTDDWIYNTTDNNIGSVNRLTAFNFYLHVTPPEWAIGYQILRTNVLNISYFMYGIVNSFTPIIDDVSVILDQISLPEEIKNRIREHFENSRLVNGNDVIADAEAEVNLSIQSDKNANKNRNNLLKLNENIGKLSTIPELAASNKLLNKYLRSNSIAPKLLQQLRKSKTINLLANSSRIFIDINNWYFGAKKTGTAATPLSEYPLNKLFYNYREGDRVRFTGSSESANPTSASQLREYDVPIIEFTGKGILIEKPEGLLWIQQSSTIGGAHYYTTEVYTPKTPGQADHLFYETGEWYPVLYPGKSNRALSKSDFVYTNNASVTAATYGPFNFFNKIPFFYADCYKTPKVVYRDTIVNPPASSGVNLTMNPDPDQTFGNWDRNNGRVATTYQNLPIFSFKKTQARFGGKIIEQSSVNNINNFKDEDQFIYPSEYGRIRNLINTSNAQIESVGSILLAIGERECWSIYINRTTLQDLNGTTNVQESEKVLGSYNTLLGSHGTLNPESVSKYRSNVYWWDVINGSWVRYGRDGLTAISDYKKRNWFKELGTLLIPYYQTSTPPKVISEFDPFNMELVVYMDHSSLPATFRGYSSYKGDVFSEKDNQWKMCHSYPPEMFAKLNNQLYAFKGGIIYKLESSNFYNTFFGVKYDSYIEPVFNDQPMDIKHWQTLTEVATNKWSVERVISEYRGLSPLIQSRITIDQFEKREDAYWAAFKADINTPNVSNPIINGSAIRCKAIQVLLKLDPECTYLSLLHSIMAGYIESPKNA